MSDPLYTSWFSLLFTLILFLTPSECKNHGPGWERHTLQLDGYDRTFYIYRPSQVHLMEYRLHLVFHGWGQHCESFIGINHHHDITHITKYAEEHNHVILAPCGLRGLLNYPSWNAGTCCQSQNIRDVEFIEKALRKTIRIFKQDHFKENNVPLHKGFPFEFVFGTGFGNGGMMVAKLLCYWPDLFDAVAYIQSVNAMGEGDAHGLLECDTIFKERIRQVYSYDEYHVSDDPSESSSARSSMSSFVPFANKLRLTNEVSTNKVEEALNRSGREDGATDRMISITDIGRLAVERQLPSNPNNRVNALEGAMNVSIVTDYGSIAHDDKDYLEIEKAAFSARDLKTYERKGSPENESGTILHVLAAHQASLKVHSRANSGSTRGSLVSHPAIENKPNGPGKTIKMSSMLGTSEARQDSVSDSSFLHTKQESSSTTAHSNLEQRGLTTREAKPYNPNIYSIKFSRRKNQAAPFHTTSSNSPSTISPIKSPAPFYEYRSSNKNFTLTPLKIETTNKRDSLQIKIGAMNPFAHSTKSSHKKSLKKPQGQSNRESKFRTGLWRDNKAGSVRSVSIFRQHSGNDTKFIWTGNPVLRLPSIFDDVSNWKERLGCYDNNDLWNNVRYQFALDANDLLRYNSARFFRHRRQNDPSNIEASELGGGLPTEELGVSRLNEAANNIQPTEAKVDGQGEKANLQIGEGPKKKKKMGCIKAIRQCLPGIFSLWKSNRKQSIIQSIGDVSIFDIMLFSGDRDTAKTMANFQARMNSAADISQFSQEFKKFIDQYAVSKDPSSLSRSITVEHLPQNWHRYSETCEGVVPEDDFYDSRSTTARHVMTWSTFSPHQWHNGTEREEGEAERIEQIEMEESERRRGSRRQGESRGSIFSILKDKHLRGLGESRGEENKRNGERKESLPDPYYDYVSCLKVAEFKDINAQQSLINKRKSYFHHSPSPFLFSPASPNKKSVPVNRNMAMMSVTEVDATEEDDNNKHALGTYCCVEPQAKDYFSLLLSLNNSGCRHKMSSRELLLMKSVKTTKYLPSSLGLTRPVIQIQHNNKYNEHLNNRSESRLDLITTKNSRSSVYSIKKSDRKSPMSSLLYSSPQMKKQYHTTGEIFRFYKDVERIYI